MRTPLLLVISLASCAPSAEVKLEARVHELEQQVAELHAKVDSAKVDNPCAVTHDVTVADGTTFDAVVPFAVSESTLHGGDEIVVHEVRGTHAAMVIDGAYLVSGEYTLTSADEATLGLTIRANERGSGCTNGNGRGRLVVKRGRGTFSLTTRVAYTGDASLSFFRRHEHPVTTNADSLGSVYFAKISRVGVVDPLGKVPR